MEACDLIGGWDLIFWNVNKNQAVFHNLQRKHFFVSQELSEL